MSSTSYLVGVATIACIASVARLVIAYKAYRLARREVMQDAQPVGQGPE